MIKCTGTITLSDGVSQLKDPMVNIYMVSANKFQSAYGVAQAGKVIEATEHTAAGFQAITNIGTYNDEGANPSFEAVQATVLAGLTADYPSVTFEVV